MKKEVGTSAGVLALLALVIHSQYPSNHESKGQDNRVAQAAQKPTRPLRPDEDQHREGPWIATRAFFHLGEPDQTTQMPCPQMSNWSVSCLTSPEGDVDYSHVRTLMGLAADPMKHFRRWSIVASVADPLHTRLSLSTDRTVEAIQRSLQADDWQLAGQGLPWGDHFDSSESDIGERRRQRRLQREQEQMPGLLVFRRFRRTDSRFVGDPDGQDVLLVFLIPEMPTNGIAGPPFFAAMHLAAAFTEKAPNPNRIGLLMPSFSGSFSSLTILVRAWNAVMGGDPGRRITGPIFGGTVSSVYYAKLFTDRTKIEFRSGIASTEDYKQVFCRVLERYHIKKHEAAYLAEDETAFTQAFNHPETQGPETACDDDNERIPSYVFPRDIAHLRNNYQDDTDSTSPARNQPNAPGVNFSIKDPNGGEDSVPTFSEAQTPLSQSAAVASIIEEFRRRRTRLVCIVSTNVLDSLFLARLIRHEAPDTRVLSNDPDILFAPAAAQDPLTGTLALSTYPMFFEGDAWLTRGEERNERIPFTNPDFEGVYNVTQSLLDQIGASLPGGASQHADRLRAFRQLQNTQNHPGLWLLTLSQTGFHPVDLMDEQDTQKGDPVHTHWFAHDRTDKSQSRVSAETEVVFPIPPRGWFISGGAVCGFALWGCFLVLRANLSRALSPKAWLALDYGTITPRLLAMAGAALALSAMVWVLFVPLWFSSFEGSPYILLALRVMGACAFAVPLLTIFALWWRRRSRTAGIRTWFYFGLISGLWALVIFGWWRSCIALPQPASLLFRFRALDLYSGASPALPFLILGLVSVTGFLLYLKRFARAGLCRPSLDLAGFDTIPLKQQYQAVNRHVMAPAQLTTTEWSKRMFISAAMLAVCLPVLQLTKYAAAFENPWYNWALACTVAMLLFSMATTCYDLVLIWKYLGRLLSLIDFLPLRESFEQITRDLPHRPIWSQQLSKHLIAKQMLVALHNRRVVRGDKEAEADFEEYLNAIPIILDRHKFLPVHQQANESPPRALAGGTDGSAVITAREVPVTQAAPTVTSVLKERRAYEKLCARLAAKIVNYDLRPLWKQNIAEPFRDLKDPSPAELHDLNLRRFCGDFVALQFSRYLIYVVTQIRLIAWCVSFGLLMLMVTLNSYSPQAPQLIGRFLAVLFLVVGAIVFGIFANLERNVILSRIAGTEPGQLNQGFWLQVLAMGILPLAGVVSHLFPSVAGYFYSWLAPGVEALH